MKEKDTYTFYSEVNKKEVDWLWYPYIPYGKITLLQGDPGDGKSTCMINIASSISAGLPLPDGKAHEPQTVLYQCAEDSISDTIKPRLEAAGADCKKVVYIDTEDEMLSLYDSRIEETIKNLNVKLVILDPIQAFLTQCGDMQSAIKMRNVMHRLANIAETYNCAIVLIGHMTKASSGKQLYRGLGSIDIAAIARSVLMIERNKNNPTIRYMFQIKNSLASEGSAVSFALDESYGFQWIGKCRLLSEIESENNYDFNKMNKHEKAVELLKIMLSLEPVKTKDIMLRLKNFGISERTARNAAKEMNIKPYRKQNVWYWEIEEQNPDKGESS